LSKFCRSAERKKAEQEGLDHIRVKKGKGGQGATKYSYAGKGEKNIKKKKDINGMLEKRGVFKLNVWRGAGGGKKVELCDRDHWWEGKNRFHFFPGGGGGEDEHGKWGSLCLEKRKKNP